MPCGLSGGSPAAVSAPPAGFGGLSNSWGTGRVWQAGVYLTPAHAPAFMKSTAQPAENSRIVVGYTTTSQE